MGPIFYVRPLRGRSYHHSLNRRLRCLRQLNQRLWIFAAFGDALASDKIEQDDALANDKIEQDDALANDKIKRGDALTSDKVERGDALQR